MTYYRAHCPICTQPAERTTARPFGTVSLHVCPKGHAWTLRVSHD